MAMIMIKVSVSVSGRGGKSKGQCNRCGFENPHTGVCQAKDKKSLECGKVGHFKSRCFRSMNRKEQLIGKVVSG